MLFSLFALEFVCIPLLRLLKLVFVHTLCLIASVFVYALLLVSLSFLLVFHLVFVCTLLFALVFVKNPLLSCLSVWFDSFVFVCLSVCMHLSP